MSDYAINIVCWNVRGLNDPDRRSTVLETISNTSCHIVCLQETKLALVDSFIAASIGGQRFQGFAQRPAIGTRGGILILWNKDAVDLSDFDIRTFSISALVRSKCGDDAFKLTGVYGPTDYSLKIEFFRELLDLKPALGTKWLALGDFNQIHRACDKNNLNIDRGRLTRFRDTLNACDLKDIHLQNRKFTWSNEQDSPTMSRIDAFFSNEEWDLTHDNHILHALSSSLSDHCPLLLASCHGPKKPHSFRFEEFWVDIPGFFDVVNKAWAEPTYHSEPYHILRTKLTLTGKRLMVWSKGLFSNAKIQLHMALQVIYHLDLAMESRQLSPEERDIRARLKRRVIGLASLERSRKKQRARINNLCHGDANTKFFHRKVNCRRRKNFILKLRHNNGWVTTHDEKQRVAQSHFTAAIGRVNPRPISLIGTR
jgi:exonuclease III